MTDTELRDDLLSFIRTVSAPAATSLIDDYVRTKGSVASSDVQRAMMFLLRSGKIVVGAGPRWSITVQG